MSAITMFSFENTSVRTLGTPELPLFVAIDVATALGYKNPKVAPAQHVDPEDLIKQEITDKLGRAQAVNCVNESGLYALIFGSKLPSAKRFKRWVTSEVLPAIRKTGQYSTCSKTERVETITPNEQHAIQVAVAKRARRTASNYQTIYRAIKNRYQIARYDQLPRSQFQDCIAFIDDVDLSAPELLPADFKPGKGNGVYLNHEQADILQGFLFYINYLFKKDFIMVYKFLCQADSPKAPQFFEAFNMFASLLLEKTLARAGYDVKDLECYKRWAEQN